MNSDTVKLPYEVCGMDGKPLAAFYFKERAFEYRNKNAKSAKIMHREIVNTPHIVRTEIFDDPLTQPIITDTSNG